MVYNYKYKLEWVGLKNADASDFYYRLKFYKKENIEREYDVISLVPSNLPFSLSYRSKSDYVFEPFRTSAAEINIFFDENSPIQPEVFFDNTDNTTWKVVLELVEGVTETSLWSGFILNSDIQYDWQDQYFLRLTATDFLGVLKEYKYSEYEEFSMFQTQDFCRMNQ